MDFSLLKLIVTVTNVRGEDRDSQMHQLLKKVLKDTTQIFESDICRAAIWVPDAEEQYLQCLEHLDMPAESLEKNRFYIGDKLNARTGVAGITYKEQNLHIVHVSKQRGRWAADHPAYFFLKGNMVEPCYASLASVPIIAPDRRCLGVLCLDSQRLSTFDDEEVVKFLYSLASRLAAAMVIYNHLLMTDA